MPSADTARPEGSPLRVLFAYRPDVDADGGAAMVMRDTMAAFRALGHEAELSHETRRDASGYDVVVPFNVWNPKTALAQLRHLHGQGTPIVWFPFYLHWSEWTWADLAVRGIFNRQLDEARREELLDQFGRGQLPLEVGGCSITRWGPNEPYGGFHRDLAEMASLADHVCTFSFREMQVLSQFARLRSKPFTVVRGGIDAARFADATPDLFRESTGVEGDFALCVAAIDSRKNQLMLVEALRTTGLKVVLIGPSFDPEYRDLVLRRGGDGVRWLDRQPHEVVASAYHAATVHVLPSFAEGSAVANLEAAAAGCPLVLSNRSSEYEYYGDLPYYCDPTDRESIRACVVDAWESRSLQPERWRAAQARVAENTWEAAARSLERACRRVLRDAEGARVRAARSAASDTGRGVAVLGMHRSGTSACTRAINLLGVSVGAAEQLWPTDRWNQKGYWENRSLVHVNDRLLGAFGGDAWAPPAVQGAELAAAVPPALREQAQSAFTTAYPGGQWVWKDPRLCLTFSFWRELIGEPACVLIYRNPLEVARSLEVRDSFDIQHSLALWERYERLALQSAAGLPAFVCPYEELLADPVDWAQRVGEFLRSHGVATSRLDSAGLLEFVEPGLRHSAFSVEALQQDPRVSPEQVELYRLLGLLHGAHDELRLPELGPETSTNEDIFSQRRRALLLQKSGKLAELLGEQVGSPTTVATLEEVAENPGLLADLALLAGQGETGLIYAPGQEAAQAAAELEAGVRRTGREIPESLDLLIVTDHAGTLSDLAALVDYSLTSHGPPSPLAALRPRLPA